MEGTEIGGYKQRTTKGLSAPAKTQNSSELETVSSKTKNAAKLYASAMISAELGFAVSPIKDGFLDTQIPITRIFEQALFKTDIFSNIMQGTYNEAENYVQNNWVSNEKAYYAGRTAGNLASIAQGIGAIIGGAAMIAGSITAGLGGITVSATGVGAIIGIPTIAIAGVALAEGLALSAVGVGALSGGAMNLSGNINKFNSSSTESFASESGLKIEIDVKPTVTNEKLENIVNDLYKGQGGENTIGNGTTMDAVRNEILTGKATNGKFHTSKLNDYVNALEKRLRAGDLNPNDEAVAKSLLEDAKNALNGK